jgi:hypothetical protein
MTRTRLTGPLHRRAPNRRTATGVPATSHRLREGQLRSTVAADTPGLGVVTARRYSGWDASQALYVSIRCRNRRTFPMSSK